MEELDLKELFNIFWKSKIQIILIVAIFVVIGFVYTTSFVTPVYTASTTLVLATTEDSSSRNGNTTDTEGITTTDITINSKLVSTYSELVKSKNVIRQVISNLGIDVKEDNVRKNVSVSSVKDTELIEISVTNINPENSRKIANEIAKVFTDKVGELYNINNVHVVDEAETPAGPSNINHIKDVLIFAVIGMVIAVMYVLIANMLDNTVKSVDDIEQSLKIPVLASIPVYSIENEKKMRNKSRNKKR